MKFKGSAGSDPGSCFPAGEQLLRCTGVQDTDKEGRDLMSKKGNNMWILEMTVDEGQYKGRKLWHYLVWLTEGMAGHGMTLKCLKAFGIDPEGENDIRKEHLLDVVVKAVVKIDDQNPEYEPKNTVAKWICPGELAKPGAAAGDAQEEWNPAELEKQEQKAKAAAKPAAPAPAAARKPLWGKK